MRYIPNTLYKRILEVIPIPCVDAVIVNRGAFLLGKRANRPSKGKWFAPGGRVIKGETFERALKRIIREETGISKISVLRQLVTGHTIHKTSAQGPGSHTINTAYLVEVPDRKLGKGDGQNSEFRWFTKINKSWNPYMIESLRRAGFK